MCNRINSFTHKLLRCLARSEEGPADTHIGGWGAATNREIVSFRSCMRAQLYDVVCKVGMDLKNHSPPLFPFDL